MLSAVKPVQAASIQEAEVMETILFAAKKPVLEASVSLLYSISLQHKSNMHLKVSYSSARSWGYQYNFILTRLIIKAWAFLSPCYLSSTRKSHEYI